MCVNLPYISERHVEFKTKKLIKSFHLFPHAWFRMDIKNFIQLRVPHFLVIRKNIYHGKDHELSFISPNLIHNLGPVFVFVNLNFFKFLLSKTSFFFSSAFYRVSFAWVLEVEALSFTCSRVIITSGIIYSCNLSLFREASKTRAKVLCPEDLVTLSLGKDSNPIILWQFFLLVLILDMRGDIFCFQQNNSE